MSFSILASGSKLGIAKAVISGAVGIGAGKIAKDIIKNHTKPDTLFDKITIIAGTWAIAGLMTSVATKYTNATIDTTVEQVMHIREQFEEAAKLGRINRKESTFEQEGLNVDNFTRNDKGRWVRVDENSAVVVEDKTPANEV